MEEQIDWPQMARYLAGESPAEEARRLEAWIEAEAPRRELVQALRRLWLAAGKPRSGEALFEDLDVQADWEQLWGKVQAQEERPAEPGRRPARSRPARAREDRSPSEAAAGRTRTARWPSRLSRRAGLVTAGLAALILLAGGALLLARLSGGPFLGDAKEGTAASSYREVVAKRGERAQLQLTDGTQITLNVESRLRIPKDFGEGTREVQLEGEAYFDVAHDPRHPFVVRSEGAFVQVLGTVFGVKAYPEEGQVEVAVKEGTVSLHAEQSGTAPTRSGETAPAATLRRGELGRLATGGGGGVDTEKVDLSAYLGWTEGQLVFKEAALPEVAARLERWYDITCEIQGGDTLRALRLTAALKGTSLRGVLEVIATSLGIRYRIEGEGRRVVLMSGEP